MSTCPRSLGTVAMGMGCDQVKTSEWQASESLLMGKGHLDSHVEIQGTLWADNRAQLCHPLASQGALQRPLVHRPESHPTPKPTGSVR